MAKRKYDTLITPAGKAQYVKINGVHDVWTNPKNGKSQDNGYTAQLQLDKKGYEDLEKKLKAIWEASPEYAEYVEENGKKPLEPRLGLTNKKDKPYLLKTSTVTEFTDTNTGIVTPNIISIHDGKRNQLPDDTYIGYGSTAKYFLQIRPYNLSTGYGVSLKLMGIQVIELVGRNSACPFDEVEGAEDISASQDMEMFEGADEVPF